MESPHTPPDELSHSLNLALTPDVIEKLKEEQNKLKNLGFIEQRFYDSSPHIAIATKFMGVEDSGKFIKSLKEELGNEKKWELEFSDFGASETQDYIFLHLSKESEQKLVDLHNRAFQKTKRIGLEVQTARRFRNFVYAPHISIIKLLPEEANKALATIKKDFLGITMSVIFLEITRQEDTEDGFSNFPVVATIELK